MAGGNDRFTKVLLHMDGTNGGTSFPDTNAGGSAHTWTATSATTSTTQVKFGTASLSTGAAAGYIRTPDSADFTLGSSNFTADAWFYVSGGSGTYRAIAGQVGGGGAGRAWQFALTTGNVLQSLVVGVSTTTYTNNATTTFTSTGWNHVALVRDGNNLKLFANGVQEGGNVAIAEAVVDSTEVLGVGDAGSQGLPWNGYIDEFRLSVGIARWTANFTPPIGPYDGWTSVGSRIRNFVEKRIGFRY